MDTLAYVHLAAIYETSAFPDSGTASDSGLSFQELDWTICRSGAWIPLVFFVIALSSLGLSSPALALQKGNSSSQVTSLQKKLSASGYFRGPITGYYGSLTQSAVRKFQKANGLIANGIADEVTLKALESSLGGSTPSQPATSQKVVTDDRKVSPRPSVGLQKGNSSSQVTSLQKKLSASGYFRGPITGYYGSLTQSAVSQFQKANGLIANGIADEVTLKALDSSSGTPVTPATPAPSQPAALQPVVTDDPKVMARRAVALQKGNRSSQVTSLQKKLQAAGYFEGPITGYYGSLTQAAVSKFQKAKGLIANGIADEVTLKVLDSSSGASTSPQSAAPQNVVTDEPKVDNSDNLDKTQKTSPSPQTPDPKVDNSDNLDKPQKTSPSPQTPLTFKKTDPGLVVTDEPKVDNSDNLDKPQKTSPSSQTPLTFKKTDPGLVVTEDFKVDNPGNFDKPQKTPETLPSQMKLKKTISGKISPKSVVYSGNGLFFAQNMMYSHTITVYDREHNLVKTIPDTVDLSKYGYSKFKGNYKGAPVETSFSHDGKYAWVSNYQMYGPGFNNPGSDKCSPAQKTDKSFLYRINTESLNIEKVIQVGSVPKFVATSPDNRLVLVSNWCSWDLSVVDTDKDQEIKRIKLGRYPRGIVVDADSDEAYIAVMGSYDIAKVDLKDFSVGWLKNIGHSPRHLNIDPAGKHLYTTLNGEGKIAKIDLSTGKVLKKVVTGNAPRSMVISDDGQRLYVVNYGSNTVSKVRTSDMKVIQKVNVGANPIGITYDPQTRQVWVACYSGRIMVFQD